MSFDIGHRFQLFPYGGRDRLTSVILRLYTELTTGVGDRFMPNRDPPSSGDVQLCDQASLRIGGSQVAPDHEYSARAGIATPAQAPGTPARIFGVVSTVAWGELLRALLGTRGSIECAGIAIDGDLALKQIAAMTPPVDIALVDITARRALEMTQRVRRDRSPLRVVALGLDGNPGEALTWAMAGAAGLVARNATSEELVRALAGVARGEAPCSPVVISALLRAVGTPADGTRGEPGVALTAREREVAELIAVGLTNKQIAASLQIEPGTVKSHVHSVIRKLRVSRRAQVAALVHRDGAAPIVDEAARGANGAPVTALHVHSPTR
jgi:DNA-binding NarL/FixJ family response regulator